MEKVLEYIVNIKRNKKDMKYKVGDKVRIKSLDWYNQNKDKDGRVNCGYHTFIEKMSKFCGQTMIVCKRTSIGVMTMADNPHYWTDEMIEGLVEEETKFGTASNPIEIKSNANCLTQESIDKMVIKIDKELLSGNQNVWELPDGYQFKDENGNVINTKKIVLEKLIEPKFKVGDRIIKRGSIENSWIVSSVGSEYYGLKLPKGSESIGVLPFCEQDDYELLPNKFDITTLKPFDKVLVRQSVNGKWGIDFFGFYAEGFYYTTGSAMYVQCVSYKGNEHLLGTTNDCDEYYKTWE
jgi:hypothetical protein